MINYSLRSRYEWLVRKSDDGMQHVQTRLPRFGEEFCQVKYSRVEAHGHWLILGWGVRDLSFGRVEMNRNLSGSE